MRGTCVSMARSGAEGNGGDPAANTPALEQTTAARSTATG